MRTAAAKCGLFLATGKSGSGDFLFWPLCSPSLEFFGPTSCVSDKSDTTRSSLSRFLVASAFREVRGPTDPRNAPQPSQRPHPTSSRVECSSVRGCCVNSRGDILGSWALHQSKPERNFCAERVPCSH